MFEQNEYTVRARERVYWPNRDSTTPVMRDPLLKLLSQRAPQALAPRLTMREWTLQERVCRDILRVCKSDLSLYILLVTMFKAVVARTTGETAVTILSPTYCADGGVSDGKIVMFQDHVLLSEDVRSNVLETRRTVVGAYSNQAIALTDIHGPQLAEEIVRDNPLCLLSNIHSLGASPRLASLKLQFTRSGREIRCNATYDSARLRPDLVVEFCSNFEQFIEAASSDYTVPVAAVNWLRGERRDRVSALSRGPVVPTSDTTLHDLFAAQARKTPGAEALIHSARTVTYEELNSMADVAAHNLAEIGVEAGDTIALQLRSPIDRIAIMLAVLKAGGAFAPISPSEPLNRLSRLLEKSHPRLLVTEGSADVVAGVRTVEASRLLAACDPALGERAALGVGADMPAYVIFTSGTSGEPKGVVVEHRGIVNAVGWKIREYAFAAAHRVLPLFGYEFDGCVLNVFAPLCSGATVILLDDDKRRIPKRIATCIDTERVTDLIAAPLVYDAVLYCANQDQFRSLQRVTLAGEAADPETLAHSQRVAPHVLVSNEYGPTEGSVVSTYLQKLSLDSVNVIGTPIANVSVYILDARGSLVPPGVVGEIFLGGQGLARGYLDGDSAMQESFINLRGERLYKTCDLGLWLPDGNIEFRGRLEGYVNVRGQRVDLEEIRAAILRRGDINDAVVVYLDHPTDGLLCACVVVDPQISLDGMEDFLRQELPDHMIPNRFVPLETLPLNAGGKIDLAALHAKLREAPTDERGLPSNDIERRLVQIWRRVLETDGVGIDDSFFSLGGHSLRAIRLLADIHENFGVELNLNQIFTANTVRRLAGVLAPLLAEPSGSAADLLDEATSSGECAVSSAQERMLALAKEHPLSYNLPILFSLDGELDVSRLHFAVQTVLARHDSLRASFHLVNGRWVQRFNKSLTMSITERVLAPEVDIEDAGRSALAPFNLEQAPLLRIVIFTVEGRQAYLLCDFHHIVVDEVSLAIILRELAMFYNGERVDLRSTYTYEDYSRAQRLNLDSEKYRTQLAAASDKLRGLNLEPLRLPFDYPPPRRRSNSGRLIRRPLSREDIAAIREICANAEVTDFVFFMAVFGLLLNKYTHQSKIVIGAPASLRSSAATRDLVGLCLNTVPFTTIIPSAATFKEYLRGIADGIFDDLGRSQVEFDDIVKALQLERNFGENPLFSVMLNIVDASVMRLPFNDVEAKYLPFHNNTSKFDLILELDLSEHMPSFSFEFPTERFLESTIQRLSLSFSTLLEDVIARPDSPISALQVLNVAERQQLLEWGGVAHVDTYDEGCLTSLFEQQVHQRPTAVALVFGQDEVTYGDLNARSNRLAHKLRSLGCGEDDVVAVFCERSPTAIIGIMAVQKAGAGHLPLDPFYPATRTAKMLLDSGARILVTDQDVSVLHFTGTVVRVDADLSDFPSANLGVPRRPEGLAYMLYTSGTTGGPKGAMVAQRNVVTLVHRATSQLSIDSRDVWTLFHSLCFDVSVWEMFGALLSGSRLVIVPREISADPDRVLKLIEKNRVTVLCQPPSAFYLLAGAMVRAGRSTSIRYVVLGGEAIKMENLDQWHDRYAAPILVNGYGITETTVYSTFKTITGEDISQRTGSIGRPLSGTYLYIVDPDLNLCPVGVIGELYIGGLGVGLGYFGRPDLTRARFVDDPFKPRSLLYRSGDLVRWLPNGEIEYVSRVDSQVKVRGYRVEIREVETAMTEFSGICESVVLAEAHGDTTQLFGFFVSGIQEEIEQLRSHLEEQLPNYMVPTRLVQVERIPVTPNGKLDREQLLSTRTVMPSKVKRSATSDLEKVLITTWAEILGIPADEIGVDDSFFRLGGDSIGANLVVNLLANRGLPVELLDLFENPTLGALVEVILSKNTAAANDASATSVELAAPQAQLAATNGAGDLVDTSDRNTAAAPHVKAKVHVPLADLRSALAMAGHKFDLRDALLTSLSVSLRMWSGVGAYRIGLLESPSEDDFKTNFVNSVLVGPVDIEIRDINLGMENLASVRACVRRSAKHRLTWNDAVANSAYMTALEGAIFFHYRGVASPESTSPNGSLVPSEYDERVFVLRMVPSGSMLVDCCVSKRDAVVTFLVPAGATGNERLELLAEMFRLAFRETLRALTTPWPPPRKAQISLDVQPFRDVFFRDCTLQAIVAAVRYFGRDVQALLANTTAVCVRDLGRARGLRVRMKYLDCRALDEILTEASITVSRSAGSDDVCEDLLECLSQGSVGIVKVDCYFVKRQRDLFQKKHGDHTILICGYDRDRRLFEIIDNEAARDIQYRKTTIGFDELREAYEGYQRNFNRLGAEISTLTVSPESGRQNGVHDEAAVRRLALETLRLAHGWREEERAALTVLQDDFCVLSSSELLLMENVEQLSFTIGELISAKRLLSYQVGCILKHAQLTQFVDEMISRLEIVYCLLTKLRVSQDYAARKVQSMQTKLDETRQFDLEYGELVGRVLEEI